jgi:hypothetical protein
MQADVTISRKQWVYRMFTAVRKPTAYSPQLKRRKKKPTAYSLQPTA